MVAKKGTRGRVCESDRVGVSEILFRVTCCGDMSAGLRPYNNDVSVWTSHDPGGEAGEFHEFMRSALGEWFDGAEVLTDDEWQRREVVLAERG